MNQASNQSWMRPLIAISLGAIAGALSRYYLGLGLHLLLGSAFPYGTGLINLSGCFAMGWFTTLALHPRSPISPTLHLLVTTGFLGSYTTFSSYQLETEKLLAQGNWQLGLFYGLGSAALGLLALSAGTAVAKWTTPTS